MASSELHFELGKDQFTVYERARLIGSRALQLAQGAKPLIDLKPEEYAALRYNPIEIAKKEFAAGKIPLSVRRTLPHE